MRHNFTLSAAKNYFFGLATSGAVLFGGLFYFNDKGKTAGAPRVSPARFIAAEAVTLEKFNPNDLSEDGWRKLGFSERQVATILKYKQVVGGNFSSKAQLAKCYSISAEKFAELEPYILLPEKAASTRGYSNFRYRQSYGGNSGRSYRSYSAPERKLHITGKFNPDQYSAEDFVKMGFSERQAASILKYRSYLGGSFQSKEKMKECFVISAENYRAMEPYLLLPETAAPAPKNFAGRSEAAVQQKYAPFDPNAATLDDWRNLGFSEKQAQVIINYRDRKLKGSFKTLEEIQQCFVISEAKFAELKPYIRLQPPAVNIGPVQPAQIDYSNVDLNQITHKQLTDYGFDSRSAAMILSYRKKLGGFMTKQQIVDTYDIDKELAQKLVQEAKLDTSEVPRYTLLDAPEEWLKSHPYFKYSADKIMYFRLSYNSERRIWQMMKVKPEYEARMKLYLK